MDSLRIGQVAKQTQLGVETIRFYERQGLIKEPPREASGYRRYDPSVVQRLRFIRRAKELGFSLQEISDLLVISEKHDSDAGQVKEKVKAKIHAIQEKIEHLQSMKASLETLSKRCPGKGSLEQCPIIASLEGRKI